MVTRRKGSGGTSGASADSAGGGTLGKSGDADSAGGGSPRRKPHDDADKGWVSRIGRGVINNASSIIKAILGGALVAWIAPLAIALKNFALTMLDAINDVLPEDCSKKEDEEEKQKCEEKHSQLYLIGGVVLVLLVLSMFRPQRGYR